MRDRLNIAFETVAGTSERSNEDWAAATPAGVVVLDGVTAPQVAEPGCDHSVEWYVQALGSRLLLGLNTDATMTAVLADAITRVAELHQSTCDLASIGTPAAAVAMLRIRDDHMEYLVLADATIVIDTTNELRVVSDTRVDSAAPEALARTRTEAIGTPEHRAAVAHMSVEQLQQRNIPGGYWVAGTNTEAAFQAITCRVPLKQVRRAALFTDGASRVVDTFGDLGWPACLDLLQNNGPRGLIRHVRRLEESDPEGRRWPRFKTSDDATAVLVEP